MRGCQVVPISSMNIPTRPIAPAIAKGRYQRIKKSPATTTITRATRQGISLKSSSWVNTSTRTPGTMITKIPTKKIPAPINRSRMNTPAIPAKPSAHSNNHSIRPTENLISCLRRAENPRREEQHRFGSRRDLRQSASSPLWLIPLGHPEGQDGFGCGLTLGRVHGVLVPLGEKICHLPVVVRPSRFGGQLDLVVLVLLGQIGTPMHLLHGWTHFGDYSKKNGVRLRNGILQYPGKFT